MNIFILDKNPSTCAKYLCDKHTVKMLLESVQILCSAYYYSNEAELSPYKLTHKNHPCSIWARESLSNWLWLKELADNIYKEYQHRYGDKTHKSGELLKILQPPKLLDIGITTMAQAMPEQYRNPDPVVAYRNYYISEKSHLFKYKNREIPNWIINNDYK